MKKPTDKERLDWLSRKPHELLTYGAEGWLCFWDADIQGVIRKSPRAAIDAAIRAEKGGR